MCCLFFLWLLCFFLCLDFFSLSGFCLLAAIPSSYDIKFEYATCTANTCQLHCCHKLIDMQTHKGLHALEDWHTCSDTHSSARLVSCAHDRGPSPRHQLQLVQPLLDGHPSLVVLPCSLLWTATGRQRTGLDCRTFVTCSYSNVSAYVQCSNLFSKL